MCGEEDEETSREEEKDGPENGQHQTKSHLAGDAEGLVVEEVINRKGHCEGSEDEAKGNEMACDSEEPEREFVRGVKVDVFGLHQVPPQLVLDVSLVLVDLQDVTLAEKVRQRQWYCLWRFSVD